MTAPKPVCSWSAKVRAGSSAGGAASRASWKMGKTPVELYTLDTLCGREPLTVHAWFRGGVLGTG